MCSEEKIPGIMTFRPTMNELKDFNSFIAMIESRGANKAGIAKIIPPPEWVPCKKSFFKEDIMKMKIPAPICQTVRGYHGLYQQLSKKMSSMTVADFKEMAESKDYKTPNHSNFAELEKIYWEKITCNSPYYGADVPGSFTENGVHVCNINKLRTILDYVIEDYGIEIQGVNTPYLYFGMWKTSFAWHTEDMDLYSINYIHDGSPKTWYAIPPKYGRSLEKLVAKVFPTETDLCPAFLRHKIIVMSPDLLKENGIPFDSITQKCGEIMITFPFGYHAGFNHGFNVAESINFASPRWIEYGKRARLCNCRENSVRFSMDTFVKRLQTDKYELWRQGNDVGFHPEDPSYLYAAPAPSEQDVLCYQKNEEIPKLSSGTETNSPDSKLIDNQKITSTVINTDIVDLDLQIMQDLEEYNNDTVPNCDPDYVYEVIIGSKTDKINTTEEPFIDKKSKIKRSRKSSKSKDQKNNMEKKKKLSDLQLDNLNEENSANDLENSENFSRTKKNKCITNITTLKNIIYVKN